MNISILKSIDEPIVKEWMHFFLIEHIEWWSNCYNLSWNQKQIEDHISANNLVNIAVERLFNAKNSENDFIQTIRIEDTIVGIVHANIGKDGFVAFNTGHLQWIWVDKQNRGLGYAQKLVDNAMRWLSSKDILGVELFVNSSNTPAISMYEKFGFEVSDFQMLAPKR